MSDAPQPKKRRRRLATPPPAEKDKEDVEEKDFYDKTVSSTYDALKSGELLLYPSHCHVCPKVLF